MPSSQKFRFKTRNSRQAELATELNSQLFYFFPCQFSVEHYVA